MGNWGLSFDKIEIAVPTFNVSGLYVVEILQSRAITSHLTPPPMTAVNMQTERMIKLRKSILLVAEARTPELYPVSWARREEDRED